MPGAINILISHRAKLIAVGLPKCGSTTLVSVFLRLEGFDPKPRKERRLATDLRGSGKLAAKGIEFLQCYPDDIVRAVAANPDYKTFSVVRDPYTRIYSAYFNKLNRYTKVHRRDLYARGQLARLLAGPRGWSRVEVGNLAVHPYLGFSEFLAELDRLGIAIDPHFDLQVGLLDLAHVHYDRLLDLRDLESGLKPLLAEFGVPSDMLARLPDVPHSNKRQAPLGVPDWLTPENRERIERLYAQDFLGLGFPLMGAASQ